jgi:hypothetical protein
LLKSYAPAPALLPVRSTFFRTCPAPAPLPRPEFSPKIRVSERKIVAKRMKKANLIENNQKKASGQKQKARKPRPAGFSKISESATFSRETLGRCPMDSL